MVTEGGKGGRLWRAHIILQGVFNTLLCHYYSPTTHCLQGEVICTSSTKPSSGGTGSVCETLGTAGRPQVPYAPCNISSILTHPFDLLHFSHRMCIKYTLRFLHKAFINVTRLVGNVSLHTITISYHLSCLFHVISLTKQPVFNTFIKATWLTTLTEDEWCW